MVFSQNLRFKNKLNRRKLKLTMLNLNMSNMINKRSGFTLLEMVYGLFFYALVQFTFLAVIGTEMNIYSRYEVMTYDDFDIFSNQFLTDHTQTEQVRYTANTLSLKENNKVGTYSFYKDSNGNSWIRYSLNGGYEPQIPNATDLTIQELDNGNFLFKVRLFDGKDYKILLPLVKKGK
ncbi:MULTISPECIES: hypothetical protein [unclassified Aerococcus]|uniref:hypothetical protein n=1 Tax=unclassified Aerococcus TaxID=2618060 RepID=UPI0025BB2AE4|nr:MULTISPECIES: hypothetical protein [unclassified Aerococcus]